MDSIQLHNGDCLEVMSDIPDKSVDMILCDLPYGTTNCKWDTIIPFEQLWQQYSRITKDNSAIVLFAAQPFTTKLINSNLKNFRYCWYWKKNNVTGGIYCKYQPMRCIEDICVFYKKMPKYYPQGLKELKKPIVKQPRQSSVYNEKKIPTVQTHIGYPKHLLEFKNDAVGNKKRLHPTQKPVDLLEYLVKTYTNKSDVVLDNCMGSGSTGVACVNTARNFIGIEKDSHYYNVAAARITNTKVAASNE